MPGCVLVFALIAVFALQLPIVTLAEEPTAWQPATIAYCDEWVSLRSQPSKSAERLMKIPLGAEVGVIPSAGEFYQCKYLGMTGFVLAEYVKLARVESDESAVPSTGIPGSDEQLYVVPHVKEYLTLKNQAGKAIDRIGPHERLRVLGWSGDQCMVERVSTGQTGYVHSGYIMAEGLSYARWPYDYDTLLNELEQLKQNRLVRTESLAETPDGREVIAIQYGDENASHHILVQCAMHAREIMTSRLGADLIWMLTDTCPDGIEDVCFHIVPLDNPDGMEIALHGAAGLRDQELASAVKKWIGKGDYRQWKANARGVDLNRNFDAGWDKLTGRTPGSKRYRGPFPHSEPESKALVDYTERYHFDCTISIHSYGGTIYWLGAAAAIKAQTKSLSERISVLTGYPMATTESNVEKGGFKDWAVEVAEIPSVTIEIGCMDSAGSLEEYSGIALRFRNLLPGVAQWVLNQP